MDPLCARSWEFVLPPKIRRREICSRRMQLGSGRLRRRTRGRPRGHLHRRTHGAIRGIYGGGQEADELKQSGGAKDFGAAADCRWMRLGCARQLRRNRGRMRQRRCGRHREELEWMMSDSPHQCGR
ncbi:hypothetical protein PVAP13_9KG076600 [Panicum virgatum]|nr:hypothetical protein PVAP13_9KG076600 [Panicum virgatum]